MRLDTVVIGKGIAAMQVQRAFREHSGVHDVVSVGPSSATGAAGLPEGIVHPFPGRSFNVPEEQWEAMRHLEVFLDEVERDFPSLMKRAKMVRPLVGGLTDRLLKSRNKCAQLLEEKGFSVEDLQLPHEFANRNALVYEGGAMIKIRELLQAFFENLDNRVLGDEVERAVEHADDVEVFLKGGSKLRARRIVWATGAATLRHHPSLAADVDRGSILYAEDASGGQYSASEEIPLWSAGVHLARGVSGLWGTGSTHFAAGDDDGDCLVPRLGECPMEQLLPKVERVMPGHSLTPKYCFTGTRLVSKDRRPLVGKVSERQSVLCGFGGTALLWSAACAHWLVRELVHGETPPNLVHVLRR
ncbi:MAG: FAD-binding oxidoreductase [Deltaproteobacteria bacterium]|nr:FAD-binding oxidoreductase [Deltaproteobacteria bacterium]